MQELALQPVPSQTLQTVLNGQQCAISIYVKTQCMFFDLALSGSPVAYAVQVKNLVSLVPTAYLGFAGWLIFSTRKEMKTRSTPDSVAAGCCFMSTLRT